MHPVPVVHRRRPVVGPADPIEWELFDLERDPYEVDNVIDDPAYAGVRDELRAELARLQDEVGDTPHPLA
ncbi:MAG: sulfatase/phosphatase domain-containing protein [Actinomycetota bacterium]